MSSRGWRAEFKRYAAPVAFLAAVTIAVLLVRSGLRSDSSPNPTTVATTIATASTPAPRHVRPKYYRLRAGETISDVAVRFNTTVRALLKLNSKIKPNQLRIGQRIRVR